MIEVKYTLKNVELEQSQRELLKEKVQRKFSKYGVDLNLDVKLEKEQGRYIVKVHGKFKNKLIDSHDENHDLYKVVDSVINKLSAQIQKIESIVSSN